VIAAGTSADPYSWKALRGSMGSAFRLPIVREIDVSGLLQVLRTAGVRILASAPPGSGPGPAYRPAHGGYLFSDHPLTGPVACLLGGEGSGLTDHVVQAADGVITIAMELPVESLNVAVSAGLIVYEARRQRIMKS
jgi:TrmH family RNA methyltransferase